MSLTEYRVGDKGIWNAGRDFERERIIKLLEDERRKCEQAGLFANGYELRQDLQTLFIGLESAIRIIKGETA